MICPQCETEYRDGITRCADCDVELVNELAPAGYDEALAPLANIDSFYLLSEVTDRLEKAGVPYIVEGGTALALIDHPEIEMTHSDILHARVWVAGAFAARAQRIWDEIVERQRLARMEQS